MTSSPRLLNVGCGTHWHPEWTNVDLVSHSPAVQQADLRRGIPYADGEFDAVYHSHVLEHLDPADGVAFLRECCRVLRPGGVLRIAAPDLETIAREYLRVLDQVDEGVRPPADLHWMRLELIDQCVRSRPGGEMGRHLADARITNADFVASRVGEEYNLAAGKRSASAPPVQGIARLKKLGRKLLRMERRLRERLAQTVLLLLTGSRGVTAWKEGLYRQSGEVHRWMYDRVNLGQLLTDLGLEQVTTRAADESRIDRFASYELDTLGGATRKPDSLFIEGVKPVAATSPAVRSALASKAA
ncbi:class I SAM-dependent methyltransferase [Lignipirellula cremea]|uniref:Methyltransferase type 11 domain-containing protein n=1 Tax=Lignipirellula cremea TaxID=2528010 RepID=A0A518E1P2_9BACT|nr:methyltransferase domain-containing protein [Lignipirellula cremea]QDU98010.1 hypothetical protein Pla8534_58710 [Lignipirellula cremea]